MFYLDNAQLMADLLKLIRKLGDLRNEIPQFLFMDGVHPFSMFKVRSTILDYKKSNPDVDEIDFILQSPGGSADDAYRIIRTLRNNFNKVNIIIPFWAKSAATLMALGGSMIIMDEFAEFGPLDAQIGKERDDSPEYDRESALNDEHSVNRIETRFKELFESMFVHLYEHDQIKIHKNELSKQLLDSSSKFYEPLLKQIDPYRLGEKRRMLDLGKDYAARILAQFNPGIPERNSKLLVDYLVNGCADHGFIIDFKVISLFLPNITVTSKSISEDYAEALSEVSGYLMNPNTRETDYVDFVLPIQTENSAESENVITSATSEENIEKEIEEIMKDSKTKPVKKTLSNKENLN